MKKFIAVFVLFSILIAPIKIPKVEAITPIPNWNVTGSYVFNHNYLGNDYVHSMSLTQNGMGELSGNGSNLPYTWVITSGLVSGNNINFSANYTATPDAVTPLTTMNITGNVAPDGSMSGTWTDNYSGGSRAGTWATTSGNANYITSGEITSPTLNQVVYGTIDLTATYDDGDEINDDAVNWAVRKDSCTTNNVFGNVNGFNDSYTWDGSTFNSELNTTSLEDGMYCFVFNPTDDAGQNDVRETLTFTIGNPPDAFNVSPADGTVMTGASVTQTWGSLATDISHFLYESYHDMLGTNLRWSETTANTSKTATNVAPSEYWWRVKAVDLAGNMSAWTNLWKIKINNTGTLTVNKNVLKPDGMTEVSDNQSFSVMLNGSNTQNVSENTSYTYMNLTPGVYTVTEGVNGNYEFVSFSADEDGMTDGAQVTVVANQNTVVTITNKQKQGTLTINKIVTNPNDGEAIATDFSFQVNGGEAIAFTDSDDENNLTGQNIISVDPGTYTITEVIPEGAYAISYSANCTNAVLTSNSNIVCTITNSDIPAGKGAITVVKNLPNDNGGDFVLSDFPLNVSGTTTEETPMSVSESVASGISEFFTPGTYVVSEDNPNELSGYTTTISCTDGENTLTSGNITVSDQQAWVCTITNDDEPAKLTIIKKVVNNAWMGTLEETFNFNLIGEDTEEEIAITTEAPEMMEEESKIYEQDYQAMGESEVITLNSGSYTLTEELLPEWNLTDISCSVKTEETENGVYLSLQNGEDVTCTFVNTRKTGTLVIEKIVVNDDGKELTVSDFAGFTINNSEPIPFESDEDEMSGGKTVILELGTYQISEPVTEGYYKVTENCEAVNITENTTKTCKFRNDDVGFFVHSGGSGSTGGSVLGASTETPTPSPTTPTETPKGEVLGATSCSTIYLNDFLYFGKKNNPEQVKLLQTFLNEELGLKLVVDGKFGRTTRNAVIAFQEKYGTDVLTPWAPFGLKSGKGTGNVYKTTKWKINMIKCADLKLEVPQLP